MQMNELTSVDLPLDWDSAFGAETETAHVDSIPDALILSLSNLARVDIAYIMEATGEAYETVVEALQGAIYQNPETWNEDPYLGWETAEEYLSGNLRRKIRAARKANKEYEGRFAINVAAIRKLVPDGVAAKDIYITLGSPWVPTDVIEGFIAYFLKMNYKRRVRVRHDEYTSSWEIEEKSTYSWMYYVASTSTYGTSRVTALEILEKTLNMQTIAVYDEVRVSHTRSGKKRVINKSETLLAVEKQQKLIEAFQNWVWTDKKRAERLESIFESKYASVRRRVFDGSFLKFPGLSPEVQLYPYQKDAVARILFSPNTLLAHDVGSGKSYIMIVAGMELKRMGLSRKNLYVVPNNLVLQWKDFFDSLYPQSRVFCVEAKNFTPEKRKETLETIRNADWDAVIMAYSCFDRIPLSKSILLRNLQNEMDEIDGIEDPNRQTAGLKRRKQQISDQMLDLATALDKNEGLPFFDDLGITRLFVDEAHNYKNVPINTRTERVLGISAGGSKKCAGMQDKVHFIQRQNKGGGVVMATGTPITNSLTDAFVMQQYLQSGELAMLDLNTFDSWVAMFAERVTNFEVDVDTNSYRMATRFSRFHNLPELTALLSSIADFHQVDECVDVPDFDGYTDSLVERSADFVKYLRSISSRAESVRSGLVPRDEDNMLKITTDGRKAALDIRLVDENASSHIYKAKKCAENAFDIYTRYEAEKGTQLIFCDISTPKDAFNIYDEVKRLLVSMGVEPAHIAFVHDATTEAQKAKLFAKVREGDVRILLGSTFKLGMGVNVQDRLIAIHHLDVPWRPADMTQREGRILRQGNRNERVYIYRYITEGSFDAYSWQLLETKQRFISEILAGSLSERSGSDIEDTVLSYAEVKALAIGNPLVKERVEAANELSRILALRRREIENHVMLEKELLEMPARIARQTEVAAQCLADVRCYRASKKDLEKEERRELRQLLADDINAHMFNKPEKDVVAMTYQGFDIVLPANMLYDRPHIRLQHEGKYYIELGDSSAGALVRVDNFLEKLSEHYQKLREGVGSLRAKQQALEEELSKKENYADRIEELEQLLKKLDKQLGVSKK